MTKPTFKLLVIFVRSIQNGVVGFSDTLLIDCLYPAFQLNILNSSQKFWKNIPKGKFKNLSKNITFTYFTSIRFS